MNSDHKNLLQIGVFLTGLSLFIGFVFVRMLIADAQNDIDFSTFGYSRFYFLIFSFFAIGVTSIIVVLKSVWAAKYLMLFRRRRFNQSI